MLNSNFLALFFVCGIYDKCKSLTKSEGNPEKSSLLVGGAYAGHVIKWLQQDLYDGIYANRNATNLFISHNKKTYYYNIYPKRMRKGLKRKSSKRSSVLLACGLVLCYSKIRQNESMCK